MSTETEKNAEGTQRSGVASTPLLEVAEATWTAFADEHEQWSGLEEAEKDYWVGKVREGYVTAERGSFFTPPVYPYITVEHECWSAGYHLFMTSNAKAEGRRQERISMTDDNSTLTPERTQAQPVCVPPPAPCSLPDHWLCDCTMSQIRWVDISNPHVSGIQGPGWFCMGCLTEFIRANTDERNAEKDG